MEDLGTLALIPAFDYADQTFDYGDVARAADLWNLPVPEPLPASPDMNAAIVAFRRARGLLSGADYRAWLERCSVTTDDVDAYLRGQASARARLILSGELGRWARRLARAAGAAHAVGIELDTSDDRLAALIAAERRFRERTLSDEVIARCIDAHRLDWQQLRWQEVTVQREGAARELALWTRGDGLEFEDAAALAHAVPARRDARCHELPAAVAPLLSAMPGDVVGPLADAERWRLLRLDERTAPAATDPAVRALAESELLDDALERHLAGRVTWHVEL